MFGSSAAERDVHMTQLSMIATHARVESASKEERFIWLIFESFRWVDC